MSLLSTSGSRSCLKSWSLLKIRCRGNMTSIRYQLLPLWMLHDGIGCWFTVWVLWRNKAWPLSSFYSICSFLSVREILLTLRIFWGIFCLSFLLDACTCSLFHSIWWYFTECYTPVEHWVTLKLFYWIHFL